MSAMVRIFSFSSASLNGTFLSSTSWKYSYHCTHKHSLFVYYSISIPHSCILESGYRETWRSWSDVVLFRDTPYAYQVFFVVVVVVVFFGGGAVFFTFPIDFTRVRWLPPLTYVQETSLLPTGKLLMCFVWATICKRVVVTITYEMNHIYIGT